ncbi:HAMP domain-containing sensor histidine kinase [Streptomyces roseicoloratus]|uniref:histidine kinase n=1 Tax=Streptomyces roseicoloratus TaxID=2508722 RepID=A0ABY9RP12_9ACTN|nr:HAMP domain-containing sensor histidine kinase [Streptomyces roseicoloratus]WMX43938.1 HAMP domain-containing sensor histidine kinase [Streptomyces roseicoloratus]
MALLNPRALRWKIAALTAAACCAVAAVIGVLVHRAMSERGDRTGEQRVAARLAAAEREYARTGTTPLDVEIRSPRQLEAPLARALADKDPHALYVTWYDRKPPNWYWLWAAQPVAGDRVLVARTDMSAEVRGLQLLDRSIVTSVLAALVVVVPLAALATEPMNRRLRHGSRTARAIAGGDLDARIGSRGRARDEITELSAAVDVMAEALQRKLENERRFTADVAHELRTPLMGLSTAAGLLPRDDEAAELVRDRALALNGLVEDLLEISRLDSGAERARTDVVPLGDLVTDVVRRTGTRTAVTARDAGVVETDPRRVERIVVNLVTNAHRHGATPVEVTVAGTRIVVRDHGPGFPATLLAEGPQRFRTGTSERGRGHGLGLTIALGQADVLGARLTFANAPDGGATATLVLSPIRSETTSQHDPAATETGAQGSGSTAPPR